MTRMRWAVAVGLFGILAAGLILISFGPKEPGYNGRSLSSWLDEWGQSYNDPTNHAAIAIRAIGSNGVPILLANLTNGVSSNDFQFWNVVGKAIPKEWSPLDRNRSRSVTAAHAINLVGVEAKSAFPTLTNLLTVRGHSLTAAIALAGMGHEGVAVLLQAVTNQDYVLRSSAVLALGGVRSDFDKVVPALIEELKHDEISLLRGVAAADLIELHKQPDLVVPAFSEFLASPDASKRAWGATLLKGFGADAKAAIPLLLKARSDEDPDVRKAAEEALVKIAPETEAKAGL